MTKKIIQTYEHITSGTYHVHVYRQDEQTDRETDVLHTFTFFPVCPIVHNTSAWSAEVIWRGIARKRRLPTIHLSPVKGCSNMFLLLVMDSGELEQESERENLRCGVTILIAGWDFSALTQSKSSPVIRWTTEKSDG